MSAQNTKLRASRRKQESFLETTARIALHNEELASELTTIKRELEDAQSLQGKMEKEMQRLRIDRLLCLYLVYETRSFFGIPLSKAGFMSNDVLVFKKVRTHVRKAQLSGRTVDRNDLRSFIQKIMETDEKDAEVLDAPMLIAPGESAKA